MSNKFCEYLNPTSPKISSVKTGIYNTFCPSLVNCFVKNLFFCYSRGNQISVYRLTVRCTICGTGEATHSVLLRFRAPATYDTRKNMALTMSNTLKILKPGKYNHKSLYSLNKQRNSLYCINCDYDILIV